jgi:hypothetical protein
MHDNPDNAVSRLLFHVDQVTDSAGSTWSSITKRGFSITGPWFNYRRKVVLQCDGQYLLIPYDFYFTDTIYTRDFYPKPSRKDELGYAVAFTPLVDAISYIIPLNLDCTVGLPEGKKRFDRILIPGYRDFVPCKPNSYDVWPINILCITLDGKEVVTTPAGTFTCYKYCIEEDTTNGSDPTKSWLFLNREVGVVKLVDGRISVVLNSVRK